MLKKHKNEIFEIIKSEGYAHQDFEFKNINTNVDRVLVKGSSLFFDFYQQESSFELYKWVYAIFAPKPRNSNITPNAEYFSKVKTAFTSWLKSEVSQFIAEREGEDLFENLKNKAEFNFEDFDSDIHEKFEQSEIAFIKTKLLELKSYVQANFESSQEQNLKIESAILYLSEAVETKSKFDWRGLLVSTVFSIITTLTLDTQKGAELWNFTIEMFRQIRLLK
ncbi:hypothetical protein HUK80_17620 [Flavobacterium sp. MAH-1]|uniref:Uncharacterized protein n=1 Tax=Flavobacterium agri TaxID=2743471 RepID=A0A7Y8Y520_9FLAO|nr:hypothetical protein [Flavobacterium agri]NUY82726.1 hypothetical protein [Flavobacterium agri]NYA72749.1 hypothetical protein [Flavobacterium agri]